MRRLAPGLLVRVSFSRPRFVQTRGWRAGKVQMALDIAVLAVATVLLPLPQALYSVLGAVAMSLFLAINHRPGRYTGS